MVSQLREAAEGLRALAGKIDTVVHIASENGISIDERQEPARRTLSGSINYAWRHFQDHFALFVIYCTAGLLVWAFTKATFFKEVPPILKKMLG